MGSKVYFKDIREQIIENLQNAKYSVDIAVAWFTDKRIINTLSDLLDDDVEIRILYYDDHINNDVYDLFQMLYNKGAEIRCSKDLMHNKFCIIDDTVVINGSYNWTSNAYSNNHENITIFEEEEIVNSFSKEFNRLFDLYKDSERKFKTKEELLEEYLHRQAYPSEFPCFLKESCSFCKHRNIDIDDDFLNQYIFVQDRNSLIQYYRAKYLREYYDKVVYDAVYSTNPKNDDNFVYFNNGFLSDKITVEAGQYIFQIDKRGEVCSEKIEYSECLAYGCYKVVQNGECSIYNQVFQRIELPQFFAPSGYGTERIDNFILLDGRGDSSLKALLYGNKYIIYNRISIKEGNTIECEEYPIFEKTTTQYSEGRIIWKNINKASKPKKVRSLQYSNTLLKVKDNKDENGIYLSDEDYLWGYIYEQMEKRCVFPISYRAFEETKNEFREKVSKGYVERSIIDDFIGKLKEKDSVVQAELRKHIPYNETPEYKEKLKEKNDRDFKIGCLIVFIIVVTLLVIIYGPGVILMPIFLIIMVIIGRLFRGY